MQTWSYVLFNFLSFSSITDNYLELALYLFIDIINSFTFSLIAVMIAGLVCSLQATDKDWVVLQGKFLLNGSPKRVVIYIEGPPAGTDILINSLAVKHAEKIPPSPPPVIEVG